MLYGPNFASIIKVFNFHLIIQRYGFTLLQCPILESTDSVHQVRQINECKDCLEGGGGIFVGKGQLGGMEYPPREMEGPPSKKYRCKMFSYADI